MVRSLLRGSLAATVAGAGIIVVASACGSGFLDGLTGGRGDSGAITDGGSDGPVDARTCTLATVPPRPSGNDTELPNNVVFAVDAVRIDNGELFDAAIPPSSGLDLDNACTCPEPETCIPPPDASQPRCDRDGGTDNTLGRLFAALGAFNSKAFGPDFATERIRNGAYSVIISIGNWNREPNDPNVFVAVFLSQGLDGSADGGPAVPQLDGNDSWTVDPESLIDGPSHLGVSCQEQAAACIPKFLDTNAYVANGILVSHGDTPFTLSSDQGRISIDLTAVTLSARLIPDTTFSAGFRLEGEFVGRWAVDRVLTALGKVPVEGTPLCKNSTFFNIARDQVCTAADLTRDPTNDGRGKPCDALSAAIHVTATPAKMGTVFASTGDDTSCAGFTPSCN